MLSLLYGAEVWTIYRTEVKKLHAYMLRSLKDIMGIKITNDGILSRAHLPWIENGGWRMTSILDSCRTHNYAKKKENNGDRDSD